MLGNPREMITAAEQRFPVRVRLAIPPDGFGQQLDKMSGWLDENCGADGWAMTPSDLVAWISRLDAVIPVLVVS
jgi:hypothetical protein